MVDCHDNQRIVWAINNNPFILTQLDHMDVGELLFQHNGVMYDTTTDATIGILHERFWDMVIFKKIVVKSPRRTCDLTKLDIFLCTFLKSQVYLYQYSVKSNSKLDLSNALALFYKIICMSSFRRVQKISLGI